MAAKKQATTTKPTNAPTPVQHVEESINEETEEEPTQLAVISNADGIEFDLGSIDKNDELIQAEKERSNGLSATNDSLSSWFSPAMGLQTLQFIPFASRDPKTGQIVWNYAMNHHVHYRTEFNEKTGKEFKKAFFDDQDLADSLKADLPGWQLVCPEKTNGQPCPICKLKWDVGAWYKANTPEGWKHSDLQRDGWFEKFRGMGYVLVKQSAGAWLQTSEGLAWQQRERAALAGKSSKSGKRLIEMFDAGVAEAIREAASGKFNVPLPLLWVMNRDSFNACSEIAESRYHNLVNPMQGTAITIKVSIDPSKGFRDSKIGAIPEKMPLLSLEEDPTQADQEAIKALISQTKDLNRYRAPWTPAIKEAVERRLDEVRATYGIASGRRRFPGGASQAPSLPSMNSKAEHQQALADAEKIPKTKKAAPTAPPNPLPPQFDDMNDSNIPFDGARGSAAKTARAVSVSGPTQVKGADGKPLCYGKHFNADSPICDVCPFSAACEANELI